MARVGTFLLTTTLLLGLTVDAPVRAQDPVLPPPRMDRPPAPLVTVPAQTVVVIDPSKTPAYTVPAGAFDPRAGTWQWPSPPPYAYPMPIRYPTTGVWYYPYPHPPSGQGVVDNRWAVRFR
jgi:hypothetical protein